MGKEKIISTWFEMWIRQNMQNIEELFSDDAIYIESWGQRYEGLPKIKLWFTEWNHGGK